MIPYVPSGYINLTNKPQQVDIYFTDNPDLPIRCFAFTSDNDKSFSIRKSMTLKGKSEQIPFQQISKIVLIK